MKRYGAGIALAWILATAASVLAATTAVDAVRERVTDRPSALVNAERIGAQGQLPDLGDGARPTVPATLQPVSTEGLEVEDDIDPVPLTGSATSSSTTLEPSTESSSSSSTANPTTAGQTASSSSSSTATTSRPAATSPPPPVTTTTSPPPPTTTSTTAPVRTNFVYVVTGGTVRIRIDESAEEVDLMGTIPKPGFRASVVNGGPSEIIVEFRSSSTTSIFRAYFENGDLVVESD